MLNWWPTWEGETLVIVASGPSAKEIDLSPAKERAKVMTINNSWQLAPWADMLLACDARWWDAYSGVPEFEGIKLCIEQPACDRWSVNRVICKKPDDRLYLEPKGTVGWGGNSGFHCLNLAVQFGVKRVLLVGYDMNIRAGYHWHGSHEKGLNNPTAGHAERWRKAIDAVAKDIEKTGLEVINCSATSALRNYPKAKFEDVI